MTERVLIILMGSIGDVIRAIPVVTAIKSSWKESKIAWLVEPKSEPILRMVSAIDKIFVFERNSHLANSLRIIPKIREYRPTIVLDMQRHLKSGIFSLLTGSKRRIGFNRSDAKEFNWLFNTEHIGKFPETSSKLKHYLKFVEHLGIDIPIKLDFGLRMGELPKTIAQLPKDYIVFCLGSSWSSKDWKLDGYVELAKIALEKSSFSIVLIGDTTKIADAESLCVQVPSERIINLVGKTSLIDLFPILSNSKVAIGPDSGPGHLAAALDKRYITLFGPTLPSRVAPYLSEDLSIISSIGCAPCGRRECPGLATLCMRLIRPEVVWQRVSEVL